MVPKQNISQLLKLIIPPYILLKINEFQRLKFGHILTSLQDAPAPLPLPPSSAIRKNETNIVPFMATRLPI